MNPLRNIEKQIDANLKLRGYTELTSIQKAIIEKEITGRDAIVSAQTGSGKTIAFWLIYCVKYSK